MHLRDMQLMYSLFSGSFTHHYLGNGAIAHSIGERSRSALDNHAFLNGGAANN